MNRRLYHNAENVIEDEKEGWSSKEGGEGGERGGERNKHLK